MHYKSEIIHWLNNPQKVRNEIQRERLNDYSIREKEAARKYFNALENTSVIRYPPDSRFLKLSSPIAVSHPGNIWSKIPMYGSTIINLAPIQQKQLIERYGWGKDLDILNLVELAKDSGRVQFRLTSDPMHYEGLDYLDPILDGLNPPMSYNVARHLFKGNHDFDLAYTEFMTAANIKFLEIMEMLYNSLEYRLKRVDDYATDYAILKILGYRDVTDRILDLLIDDPNLASYLFTIYGNFIVVPAMDSTVLGYSPTICYDKEDYSRQIKTLKQSNLPIPEVQKLILPSEIGRILAGKLVLHCTGFNGCISMIDRYTSQDLQKLLSAIQLGCERADTDFIIAKSQEVEEVFDNIWKDANKVSNAIEGIDYGVLISIGLVGTIATMPLGGIGGLIASLGFSLLEKKVTPIVSNNLTRVIFPNRIVTIYDFKERHQLG